MDGKFLPSKRSAINGRARSTPESRPASSPSFVDRILSRKAIRQLDELGAGFAPWLYEMRKGSTKPTKVALAIERPGKRPHRASSTDPDDWGSLNEAIDAFLRGKFDGIGVRLGQLPDQRHLEGKDIDALRSPQTGELAPEAARIVGRVPTYWEVSPSGSGVKGIGLVDQLPAMLADGGREFSVPWEAPAGATEAGHEHPSVAFYPSGRWFALTGELLEGAVDEVVEIDDVLGSVVGEIARIAVVKPNGKAHPKANGHEEERRRPAADLSGLPPRVRALLDNHEEVERSFLYGEKLGGGGDTTASGLDHSLAKHLGRIDLRPELIEEAIRAYPWGQVGSGKLGARDGARQIKKLLAKVEKDRERRAKFDVARTGPEPWRPHLILSNGARPIPCEANVRLILQLDPAFAGNVRLNEMTGSAEGRDLPWRAGGDWQEWSDEDDLGLADWCQTRGVVVGPDRVAGGVQIAAFKHRHHPVRAYLGGLAWDGTERLDKLFTTYFGVQPRPGESDDRYLAAIGKAWPISAVARAFEPGVQVDTALVLEGEQGRSKGKALRILARKEPLFAELRATLATKEAAETIGGKWLVELSELSSLRRSDAERTKAFISCRVDRYRPAYGRRARDFPRTSVLVGTTNRDAYLSDETGNRRFWPVLVGEIDLDALRRDVDQLWAEAVARYRRGEPWWLDAETEAAAREQQEDRLEVDPWDDLVMQIARRLVEAGSFTTVGAILEAMALAVPLQQQRDQNRVARILRAHGWERRKARTGPGGRTRLWCYEPPAEEPDEDGPSTGEAVPVGGAVSGTAQAPDIAAQSSLGPSGPSGPSKDEKFLKTNEWSITAEDAPEPEEMKTRAGGLGKQLVPTGPTGTTPKSQGAARTSAVLDRPNVLGPDHRDTGTGTGDRGCRSRLARDDDRERT